MAFKDWFGTRGGGEPPSIDDLIALGEIDRAEDALRAKIRSRPSDLHSHLRLADLLMSQKRRGDAVEEYLLVAEGYARDGFYEKASALLSKISKLAPGFEKVEIKIEALKKARELDHRRDAIIDGLMEGKPGETPGAGTSAFELKRLWKDLARSSLLDRLDDEQLKRLFRAFRVERLDEGERLIDAGQRLEEIYLIAHGEIEVRVRLTGNAETVLKSFGPGAVVGERALFQHQPWPASYVAGKRSSVLKLTREALEQALVGESDPKSFLDALREQQNDRQIVAALAEMREAE